jgi:elongation factor Ts
VGLMDCKAALQECDGDFEKAMKYLREKGLASAAKKADRSATDGTVASYIHAGSKLGVLIEVSSETDFVAKTTDFQELAKNLAMHVAAAAPAYVKREDVPAQVVEQEREIYKNQMADSKKPAEIMDKIITGKLDKFFQETCLLEQAYIKDPDKKISDLIADAVAKVGENIQVKRFARFAVGQE